MKRMRWVAWLSLSLICLPLSLLTTTVVAQADGPLAVETNEHHWRFGESLQFHLTVSSSAAINSIVLAYRTGDNQGTTVERLEFEPKERVELIHDVDLIRRPLKPFVKVEYWWAVADATDQRLTTETKSFIYEDNRFAWQDLSGRQVVLHWYNRDPTFGPRELDIADQAVERIREMIAPALALSAPFHLYIYASETDLAPALPQSGREWAVGQAYPELRLAVVAVPPGPESISTVRQLIPHELTHLLLFEAVGSDYGRLPPWLNEGLAVVSEEIPDPDEALLLAQAFQQGQLFSLDVLCYSFPREGGQVHLAYAQSASIVRFILENYGYSAVQKLVSAYDDGLKCGEGVREAMGMSLGRLEAQWRESLGTRSVSSDLLRQVAPWALLVLSSLPLLLLIAQPLIALRKRKPHARLIKND